MKKILQVAAYAAPYDGNFIRSLLFLDNFLQDKGYETLYAFPESAKTIEWCRLLASEKKVYFLPLAKARILPKTYFLMKKIFKENSEIVIAHSHFELYDVPLSLVAPKQVKVFWHLHDAIETYLKGYNRIVWKLQYSVFSKRAVLLSVSEKHLKVVTKLGFNSGKAFYVPNAIDVNRIKDAQCGDKIYDFVIFGWDFYRKGVDLALKAIHAFSEHTLAIVGSSTSDCNKYNTRYILLEPEKDVNKIFRSARCFLHISRAEGLSYALLEALYSGIPVIVSDISENLFAKEMPTAFLVSNENQASIEKAMEYLVSLNFKLDPDLIEKTRMLIREKYSLQSWANNIFSYYIKN